MAKFGSLIDTSSYRPDIDGLRAIAVAAVVVFHAHLGACASGFVGVDVFFVISGYLIAGIIFRDTQAKRFSFSDFYARRARRILPALIVVMLATMAAGLLFLGPDELGRKLAPSVGSSLLGLSNFYFYYETNYFTPDASLRPSLMTWSLGVEEQFYALFPITLIAFNRFFPKHIFGVMLALTVGSLILSVGETIKNPSAAFFLPIFRGWELGCGALLAIGQGLALPQFRIKGKTAEALSVLGLALLVAGIFFLHGPFPGWRATIPVAGTAALILSESSFVNQRLLSFKPLVGVGLVSYSWYLWHWPLMSFTRIVSVQKPPDRVMAAMVVLSLLAGILSWRFIETPFRNVRTPASRSLPRYGIALAAVLLLVGGVFVDHGVPFRISHAARSLDAQVKAGLNAGACLADRPSSPDLSSHCVSSGPAGQIALLGDSHAHALAPGLRLIAQRHGYGVAELTKKSCPALIGVTRVLPGDPRHALNCARFNEIALRTVLGDPEIKLVVIGGYWAGPSNDGGAYATLAGASQGSGMALLQDGLIAEEQALTHAGKRVIVMRDEPMFTFDAGQEALTYAFPARLAAHRLIWGDDGLSSGQAPWRFVHAPQDGSDIAVRNAAESIKGILYYDSVDQLCTAPGCVFSNGSDTAYYADNQHLSAPGSILALQRFEDFAFPGNADLSSPVASITHTH